MNAFTRPQTFAALREIVRSLSSAWDLDTALDLIARKTTEVMQVDSCTIYLLDPDGQSLRLQASTGLARRALGRSTLRVGEGMTGYAVLHNQPVFAAEAGQNPHFKVVEEADEAGFKSLLAVPLVIDDEPIGALNVQTADSHEYSADEVEILSLIGDLAATTLARAQLYDRQQRQIAELRTLAQVSETVTSPLYLDEMLGIVSEMAAQIMDASICHFFLLDDASSTLQRHAGSQRQLSEHPRFPLNQGIIGRVAASGHPAYVPDLSNEPEYEEKEWARSTGLVSLLSVPLSVRDRVIGVLNCYTEKYREFSDKERTLLLTLANQTALAIENAQLITNTAVVREMHHRIKNNLQTIAMLMQMQIYETDLPATRHALETNIHRVHSIALVHEVLSEKGFRLVNVKDVIDRITRETSATMITPGQDVKILVHGQTLQLPSRPATALALVVNELVQNALQHGLIAQKEGQIDISLGHSPEEFIILVRDNGGPDNGLFAPLIHQRSEMSIYQILQQPRGESQTFHGRDLFASVAAKIVEKQYITMKSISKLEVGMAWSEDLHKIIYVDHFGNLFTGLRGRQIERSAKIRIADSRLSWAPRFDAVTRGDPFWYVNSCGLVEIAVNEGRADLLFAKYRNESINIVYYNEI